jgi:hypothetical protein
MERALFSLASIAFVFVFLFASGCARPGAWRDVELTAGLPSDPCDGAVFDADDPDPRCLRHAPSVAAPDASAIAVAVRGDTVVRSGAAARVVLELRNTSDEPVAIDIDGECAFAAASPRADAGDDCAPPCARGVEPRVVHLQLEP